MIDSCKIKKEMIVYIDPVAEQIMTDHAVNTYPVCLFRLSFGNERCRWKKFMERWPLIPYDQAH